jgi:phage recombination protein Bet
MSIAIQTTSSAIISFDNEQKSLIKNYLCKGINDEELTLFAAVCKKTGLDPFMKQIYAVKRKDQMTIQTSIDGYRLIAERTGRYAPGKESQYNKDGALLSATSFVKKQTQDGTWHEIGATAFFDEYKPSYSNQFWDSKKHIMLAKCAESLALRKAFPNELSGLYSEDEMHQAEVKAEDKSISAEQANDLALLIDNCIDKTRENLTNYITNELKVSIYNIPVKHYEKLRLRAIKDQKPREMVEEAVSA